MRDFRCCRLPGRPRPGLQERIIRTTFARLICNCRPNWTRAYRNLREKSWAMPTIPTTNRWPWKRYLRTNFAYTLNLTGKPGADPLAHFLFETKAGHCEYFATAMAVMLRTLGIPSREVNGFLPGEYNDVGGDYIVRASDAHSWVEAYFPGSGWVTFDPTPPSNDVASGLLSRLALYVDWFQLTWNEWVINYDFSHQITLARNVGQASADWKEQLRRKFQRLQDHSMERMTEWQRSHDLLRFAVPVLLLLSLVFLRLGWMRALFRWLGLAWLARLPEAQRNNPVIASRLYAELLRLLEKRGFPRKETETPSGVCCFDWLAGGIGLAGAGVHGFVCAVAVRWFALRCASDCGRCWNR